MYGFPFQKEKIWKKKKTSAKSGKWEIDRA